MPVQPLNGLNDSKHSRRLPAGKTAGLASPLACAPTAKRGSAPNTCGVSASPASLLRFAGAPETHRTTPLRSLAPGHAHAPLRSAPQERSAKMLTSGCSQFTQEASTSAHPLKSGRCRLGFRQVKQFTRCVLSLSKQTGARTSTPIARLLRPPPAPRQTTPQTPHTRHCGSSWRGDSGGLGLRAWQLHAGLGGKTTRPPALAGARSFHAAQKKLPTGRFFGLSFEKGR